MVSFKIYFGKVFLKSTFELSRWKCCGYPFKQSGILAVPNHYVFELIRYNLKRQSVTYYSALLLKTYHWVFVDGVESHDGDVEVDNRGVAVLLGRAHLVVQFRVLGQYVVEGEAARTPDKKQQRSGTKVRLG